MRAISLFAGIGGFDLALERAGVEVVAMVEIDKACQSVLRRHFPKARGYANIKTVDGRKLGNIDLVVGGFPCQDVSVAGKRAGLAGERTGLFFEAVRIINETTPQYVILENVPGLLSSNEGRDMGTVLGTLAELGYGLAYRILDAQYFGVPQRRRRVFIVGSLGDWNGPREILFEPESLRGPLKATRKTSDPVSFGFQGAEKDGFPCVVGSLVAEGPRKHAGTMDGHAIPDRFDGRARQQTPVEWERLQGFPDDWTAEQSDAQRYRQLGNAVAVPVVEWIARRLVTSHNASSNTEET